MSGTKAQAHIVVINDTQEILELFQDILEGEGNYKVTLCSYKPQILEDIRSLKPDLVITDLIFGEERVGWQLVQMLHMDRELLSLPVIVCSAASHELRDMEGHLTNKSVSLLYKPFDVDELLNMVETSLKREGVK